MTRKRRVWIALSLFLGGLQRVPEAAFAQDVDRSVVVGIDGSGRVMPGGGGTAKRYWADAATNSIRRSNLDGTAVEVVVTGLNAPYGLSLDPASGAFLWTSSGDEVVQKLATDGGAAVALRSEFEEPFAIALPAEEGRQTLYAVIGAQVLRITRYDDSKPERQEVLMGFDPSTQTVHGLALDEKAGVLYVGNVNGMMTQRINLTDNQVQLLSYSEEPLPLAPKPATQEAR